MRIFTHFNLEPRSILKTLIASSDCLMLLIHSYLAACNLTKLNTSDLLGFLIQWQSPKSKLTRMVYLHYRYHWNFEFLQSQVGVVGGSGG